MYVFQCEAPQGPSRYTSSKQWHALQPYRSIDRREIPRHTVRDPTGLTYQVGTLCLRLLCTRPVSTTNHMETRKNKGSSPSPSPRKNADSADNLPRLTLLRRNGAGVPLDRGGYLTPVHLCLPQDKVSKHQVCIFVPHEIARPYTLLTPVDNVSALESPAQQADEGQGKPLGATLHRLAEVQSLLMQLSQPSLPR